MPAAGALGGRAAGGRQNYFGRKLSRVPEAAHLLVPGGRVGSRPGDVFSLSGAARSGNTQQKRGDALSHARPSARLEGICTTILARTVPPSWTGCSSGPGQLP